MLNQAKLVLRVLLRGWLWIDVKVWKWKTASLLPEIHSVLRIGRQDDVGLLGAGLALAIGGHVLQVVASYLVLRAVPAVGSVRTSRNEEREWTYHCGKVSSHLICRRLQVLHPLRLFVWLRREGPAPWGAIGRRWIGSSLGFREAVSSRRALRTKVMM